MTDLRAEFERILSPAIDVKAPYAKVMIGMLVDAALAQRAGEGDERHEDGRRKGHSKLVYDKATRSIVPVDPKPAPAADAVERVVHNAVQKARTLDPDITSTFEPALVAALVSALPSGWRPIDSAPDGWVLVPREPTEAMRLAAEVSQAGKRWDAAEIYRAMLDAAPKEPNR